MKFLLIVLLIAVVVLIGWMSARSRAVTQAGALPDDDRPDELGPSATPDDAVVDPPFEPDPVVEPAPDPEPVVEPEPVIEPDEPPSTEPEPVVEPDTAGVEASASDHPVADPDESTDPPRAVIEAGEVAAKELDPEAGWELDEDQTIHADPQSGLYHTPDSPGYKSTPDGQVFDSEEAAQSAGFSRWDRPD